MKEVEVNLKGLELDENPQFAACKAQDLSSRSSATRPRFPITDAVLASEDAFNQYSIGELYMAVKYGKFELPRKIKVDETIA